MVGLAIQGLDSIHPKPYNSKSTVVDVEDKVVRRTQTFDLLLVRLVRIYQMWGTKRAERYRSGWN